MISAERFARVVSALQTVCEIIREPAVFRAVPVSWVQILAEAREILDIEELARFEEWQHMRTAPKDGSTILIWSQRPGGDDRGVAVIGFWGATSQRWLQTQSEHYVGSPQRWHPLPATPIDFDQVNNPVVSGTQRDNRFRLKDGQWIDRDGNPLNPDGTPVEAEAPGRRLQW